MRRHRLGMRRAYFQVRSDPIRITLHGREDGQLAAAATLYSPSSPLLTGHLLGIKGGSIFGHFIIMPA
jgi:hypothetical protein